MAVRNLRLGYETGPVAIIFIVATPDLESVLKLPVILISRGESTDVSLEIIEPHDE